jgi:hypothetical protein
LDATDLVAQALTAEDVQVIPRDFSGHMIFCGCAILGNAARLFDYVRQLQKEKENVIFANSAAMSPAPALKLRASALGPPREALPRPVLTVCGRARQSQEHFLIFADITLLQVVFGHC